MGERGQEGVRIKIRGERKDSRQQNIREEGRREDMRDMRNQREIL